MNKDLGMGQKRVARSEAEEEGGSGISNGIKETRRKRGERGMHGK